MDENILEQILRVGGLCNSILEGAEYYISHREEVSLLESTKEAVQVVASSSVVGTDAAEVSNSLRENLDNADISASQVMDLMQLWYKTVYDILNKKLLQEIKKQASLTKEQAESIFQYMNQIYNRMESYYSLLINVCAKAGFSSPELSYTRLKEAFSE